jgi:hypothetical protein
MIFKWDRRPYVPGQENQDGQNDTTFRQAMERLFSRNKKKFKQGEESKVESCPICMENFNEGEEFI